MLKDAKTLLRRKANFRVGGNSPWGLSLQATSLWTHVMRIQNY